MDSQQPTLATCRSRVPTDINIRSILSHVWAEALVQCAQPSILDMEAEEDFEPLSSGLTPLNAKLAAYGESLALERRLKRAEEERNGDPQVLEDSALATRTPFARDSKRSSRSRRIHDICALESPRTTSQSRLRIRQPRRPTTGDSGM